MNIDAQVRDLLKNLPEDASPRSQWPAGDPRKQTAIETRCFEDGATIYFDRLAPLQSWAFVAGMGMKERTGFIVTNTARLALEANVKLNQGEIDAISETYAKNYKRASWSAPMAGFITGAVVYRGRENFRFPFYTPTPAWFAPYAFPTQRIAILKGTPATYMWHAFRFMAYYPLLKLATTLFYSSVIRMSITADIMSDKRMSRINEELRKKLGSSRKSSRNQKAALPQSGEQASAGQLMEQSDSEQREESYRRVGMSPPPPEEIRRMVRQRQSPEAKSTDQQDTQGTPEWSTADFQRAEVASQANEAPARKSGWVGRSAAPATPSPAEETTKQERSSAWGDSELFEGDDSSPVSPAARRADQAYTSVRTRAQTQREPGASSWDRVRQQAKSDMSPFAKGDRSSQDTTWSRIQQETAARDRDRERTPPSDNYSYNEADESKEYAKSQAQKDFDAMLEAERKGEASSAGKAR